VADGEEHGRVLDQLGKQVDHSLPADSATTSAVSVRDDAACSSVSANHRRKNRRADDVDDGNRPIPAGPLRADSPSSSPRGARIVW